MVGVGTGGGGAGFQGEDAGGAAATSKPAAAANNGATAASNGAGAAAVAAGGDEKVRNPRWMRHETAMLVAAKRKHDEEAGDDAESVPAHKKWGAIALAVKEKNVDRDARQCRKRWSNLFQDYRRIRDWMRKPGIGESYWTMRHDKRRENKLPGSFDSEVYADMDAFLSKKRGITPRAASDSAVVLHDEGLGSEIEQDHEALEAADVGSGDGSSGPGTEKDQTTDSAAEDRKKRNSKWTKHETVHLLIGKSKYDGRTRDLTPASKSVRSDEKWDNIATYCRSKGIDRDAQQCRKRWSNLHNGDYKKIRDWQKKPSVESYWDMKSEDRRHNKLPGFFDPQVYHVMDAFCTKKGNGDLDGADPAFEELLSSEVDQDHEEQNAPGNSKDGTGPSLAPPESDECRVEQQGGVTAEVTAGRKKRKRLPNGILKSDEGHDQKDWDEKDPLVTMLETSGESMQSVLTANIQAQIEAHKWSSELDRNQRKQQGDNLVGVLNKLAEAVAKIADKL